jgi:hypothetical protein
MASVEGFKAGTVSQIAAPSSTIAVPKLGVADAPKLSIPYRAEVERGQVLPFACSSAASHCTRSRLRRRWRMQCGDCSVVVSQVESSEEATLVGDPSKG